MTAILVHPATAAIAAAERLLTRRTGASVTLADPVDLGGSDRTIVLRVRAAANPFSLPRTMVVKQALIADGRDSRTEEAGPDTLGNQSGDEEFLREAVSYQFATALAKECRPGPELVAYDLDERLLVLTDLGDAQTMGELLAGDDEGSVTNSLMALAQALGRMHAATVGREEDFAALLRRAGVGGSADRLATQVAEAIPRVPPMLATYLGVRTPDRVVETAAQAERLFGSAGFRAFSPADLCPENILVTDDGVRFLDYEWGGFRDATLDLAYALVSFPACLCSFELSSAQTSSMVDAWRAEVSGIWPQLGDDDVLYRRILDARMVWVWLSTFWFLPQGQPRSLEVQTHTLSASGPQALQKRWAGLAEMADQLGVGHIATHADSVANALSKG